VSQGSLVFCGGKSSEISPLSGREGKTLTTSQAEGATQAPAISSEGERKRVEPLERNKRVCGEYPTQALILMEKPVLYFVFRKTL